MPLALSQRLRDRLSLFTKPQSPPNQDLRIPLELILHIFDLASTSCEAEPIRDRVHSRFAAVNRTFARLYGRRKYQTVGMADGTQVPELVERLKRGPSADADWLEGVEIEDLGVYYSRRRLEQQWPKLRKACKNLVFVQLGSYDHPPQGHDGFNGYALAAMTGITTLRLIGIQVHNTLPNSSILSFKKRTYAPMIPAGLRHLVLDHVQLRYADYADYTTASLWRTNPAECQLTSLYFTGLKLTGFNLDQDNAIPLIRKLLSSTAPSLKALHFSRPLDVLRESTTPPVFDWQLAFPALRILSISLYHFNLALVNGAPGIEHLSFTFCDLLGMYDTDRRMQAIASASSLVQDALGSGSGLQRLRALELPVQMEKEDRDRERAAWAGLEQFAREKGVAVEFVEHDDLYMETHFRLLVREKLMEKM
ncbi:hypothetical protein JCM10207_001317 [Rhodosporidiobolus poonsookiae]